MERRVVVVTLVVAIALATVPSGGLAQSGDASVAPGERFAGVVGVQGAELGGAVATRTLQVRLARAESPSARAAVVADQVNGTRERIDELARRRERLREARNNGTISEGQYRARLARLVAESHALQRRVNRTADASRDVPDAALRAHGVEPDELDRLRRGAGNLTGPEVAAVARGITGDDGRGPPAGVAPGRTHVEGNGSERGSSGGAANASADRGGPPTHASTSARNGNRSTENATDRSERTANRSVDATPRGGPPTRAADGTHGTDSGGTGSRGRGTEGNGSAGGDGSAPRRGTGNDAGPSDANDTATGRRDGNATGGVEGRPVGDAPR
ncbi:MAG: hypothetical protein ABEJ81_00230 [Haloferacaceae archaeon]